MNTRFKTRSLRLFLLLGIGLLSSCSWYGKQTTKVLYDNTFSVYTAADQWVTDQPSENPDVYINYKSLYFSSYFYTLTLDGKVHFSATYKTNSSGTPSHDPEDYYGTYTCSKYGDDIKLDFGDFSRVISWKKWYLPSEVREMSFDGAEPVSVYVILSGDIWI
jgi:hypothetical protein